MWQCVSVSGSTTYNFGANVHTATGSFAHCQVELFTGPGCASSTVRVEPDLLWLNTSWGTPTGSVTTASNEQSARVSCYNDVSSTGGPGTFYVDMIYLSPAPATY